MMGWRLFVTYNRWMAYNTLFSRTVWVVPALCLFTGVLHSTAANACDPAFWYWDTVPHTDEPYPSNAAPMLKGYGSIDEVSATIDGVDATVTADPELSKLFIGVALQLDPPPAPGQTVVITYPGEGCDNLPCPNELTYIASEPDTTTPTAATVDELNVVRYASEEYDSCGDIYGGVEWWLHLQHQEDDTGAPEFIDIRGYDPEHPETTLVSVTRGGGAERASLARAFAFIDGLAALPDSLCFEVEVMDMTGKTSEVVTDICQVCHFRDGEPSDDGNEPEWDETDIVPGGVCGAGPGTDSETDSGETDPSETDGMTDSDSDSSSGSESASDSDTDTGGQKGEGCSCKSSGSERGAWLLGMAALLGLRRRRR